MRGLDVSVIIAGDRAGRMLSQCLAHLEVQSYPAGRFEVIVCCGDAEAEHARIERLLRGSPVPTRALPVAGASWAAAMNAGVEVALGRWLLFLNADLLAGPGLVEHHVRTQEAKGGRCAVIGFVGLHPHVDPATFTPWDVLCEPSAHQPGDARPWHVWRAYNLSVPREAVIAAGAFDLSEEIASVADLDLAYRLAQQDTPGYYAADATAYGLRATTLAHERRRHYNLGYDTHALLRRTAMPQLRTAILGGAPRGTVTRARLELPVWEQLSTTMEPGSPTFRQLVRRILHLRAHQGFADAHASRPRRSFASLPPLPTPDTVLPGATPE